MQDAKRTPCVLVVDDCEQARYATARSLRQAGYTVIEAGCAKGCFAAVSAHQIQLIVLDVNLPDVNGGQVCARLKADPKTSGIPIIQTSAVFTRTSDRITGLESGADAYLVAPFDPRELYAQVRALLRVRETEAALRESEARFRSVIEGSRDIIYRYNLQTGRYEYISGSAHEIVGYSPEELVALDLESSLAMIHPEDLPGMRQAMARLEKLGSAELEYRQKAKSGVFRWLCNYMSLVRNAQGKPLYRDGSIRDITDRKVAEHALETAARIPAENPDCVMRLAQGRRIDYANPAAKRLLSGMGADGDAAPADLSDPAIAALKNGNRRELEIAYGGRTYLVNFAPVPSEGYVNLYARDITRRKLAEVALKQTVNFDPQIPWTATPDGAIEDFSPRWLALTGKTREQSIGFGWTRIMHPDELAAVRVRWEKSLRTGEPFDIENRIRTADGTYRWVRTRAFPHRENGGAISRWYGFTEDIQERVDAEQALRASEERLRIATDAAHMFCWDCDLTTGKVRWSENAARIIGCSPDELGLSMPDWVFFAAPEEIHRISVEYDAMIRNGTSAFTFEFSGREPAPETRFWVAQGRIAYDESGTAVRMYGVTQDITGRKRTELELARRAAAETHVRELLQSIFDNIPVVLWLWDSHLKTFRFNRHMQDLFGWTEADAADGDFITKVYPDPVYRQEMIEYMLSMHPGWRDLKLTAKDGSVIDLSWANIRLSDGTYIGIGIDIRERRRSEEALRLSEAQFRAMFESAGAGMAQLDIQAGRFIRVNREFCEMTGYSEDELLALSSIVELAHPEERNAALAGLVQAQEGRVTHGYFAERRYLRKDGRALWVAIHGSAVSNAQNELVYGMLVFIDITQRKKFEAELERLVAERTAKLHEAMAELEHFSYSITHDMRAPLRAVRGFAEVLNEICGSSPDPEMLLCVKRIITSAARMDLLITDALNYNQTVRHELPLAPVDLHQLVCDMLDTYPSFVLHRHNIQVSGQLHTVIGNEAALIQCFSNLIGNALKFVPAGEDPKVLIRSEVIPAPIVENDSGHDRAPRPAETVGSSQWVRVWVEDCGIGIPPSMLPRVFNMFTRASKEYEGTGIGLALVRKVVQRMGGKVNVESDPGKGSRFWIELPAAVGQCYAGGGQESLSPMLQG